MDQSCLWFVANAFRGTGTIVLAIVSKLYGHKESRTLSLGILLKIGFRSTAKRGIPCSAFACGVTIAATAPLDSWSWDNLNGHTASTVRRVSSFPSLLGVFTPCQAPLSASYLDTITPGMCNTPGLSIPSWKLPSDSWYHGRPVPPFTSPSHHDPRCTLEEGCLPYSCIGHQRLPSTSVIYSHPTPASLYHRRCCGRKLHLRL